MNWLIGLLKTAGPESDGGLFILFYYQNGTYSSYIWAIWNLNQSWSFESLEISGCRLDDPGNCFRNTHIHSWDSDPGTDRSKYLFSCPDVDGDVCHVYYQFYIQHQGIEFAWSSFWYQGGIGGQSGNGIWGMWFDDRLSLGPFYLGHLVDLRRT